MELHEMQAAWQQMSKKIEKQQQLTDHLIMEMTQQKYKAKYQKLNTFETVGGVICYIFATYLLLNFDKLDTWYLQACGIFGIAILVVLPLLTLSAIAGLQKLSLTDKTQKVLLQEFAKRKKRFMNLQQLSLAVTPLFMVVALPIMSKILNGKDLFVESDILFWYIPIGAVLLFFFYRWVFKCYRSINASAAKTLEELGQ